MLVTGILCWPTPDKIIKWLATIDEAIKNRSLDSGQASKMAGRLQWACQSTFKRMGRAMLIPIFQYVMITWKPVSSNAH